MDIFNSRYYWFLKVIFSFQGIWPFQSHKSIVFMRSMVFIAVYSIVIPKLIKLGEEIKNFDGIIECIPMIGLHSISICKYFNWIFNAKKMKNLLMHIQRDWDELKYNEEITIMHEFSKRGRKVNVLYSSAMFSILGMYLASPSFPIILDKIYPLNETRNHIYLYQTEYFVDPDEYYIPILIHAYLTVPISLSILVFVDTMFAMYIHHVCGMFAILRIHLEWIHHIDKRMTNDKIEQSKKISQKIALISQMHSKTIKFCNELESSSAICYLIVFGINLAMVTLCGMMTVILLDRPSEAVRFFAFTVGDIFHLLFSSLQGQKLIDESEAVFHSAYMSEWYGIPVKLQRLLLPIMAKSLTPCKINAGSLFILSMDSFSKMLKSAVSYFTVLLSMRQR